MPFITASIGMVTSCSTSSAASVPASAVTITEGWRVSGSRSIGMSRATSVPHTISTAAATSTKTR